jgi:hypothetical protein
VALYIQAQALNFQPGIGACRRSGDPDISERPPRSQLGGDAYVASAMTFQATEWVARDEQTQDVDQAKPGSA